MSGRQTDLVKLSISLIAFVTCSICVVAVFSVGFKINPSWKELFDENELYMTFYLICYALSFIPGLMVFKNRHVVELKKLGVF
ncbi:hypothetical protein HOP38_05580 [Vibrio mediterranei]|uniref:hypothetical protein n=1 Tax=Vibrio mediterranei TaxID=689 RepID=UPI001811DBEB|nr:hypothetical protein [Vibrio mediterranei]NUW71975.1 hypothetical protein [Vibrio mediterranei]